MFIEVEETAGAVGRVAAGEPADDALDYWKQLRCESVFVIGCA